MNMNEKIYNLLHDSNVYFFLTATPKLKEMIVANEHPYIVKLRQDAKTALLADQVIILDKDDVYNFVQGSLEPHEAFLFSTGEIRVAGQPGIKI